MKNAIEIGILGPKSIALWFDEIENIDFSPRYQRTGNIWTREEQQFLIDSIINEFDLPKLYFADFTGFSNALNEKSMKYAIIDGKQRLTAIFSFMRNEFPLSKEFKYLKDPSISLKGLKYEEIQFLYPKIARRLDGFLITVMGVKTDNPDLITELFLRLNRGRPLKGAELRNADSGATASIIRKLADHPIFTKNVAFATSRLQNFDAASKIILMEVNDGFVDTKKSNLDDLLSVEKYDVEGINLAYERALTVLDNMYKKFEEKDKALGSSGLFPVVYWLSRNHPDKIEEIRAATVDVLSQIRKGEDTPHVSQFRLSNRNTNDKSSLLTRYEIIENIIIAK